MRELKERPEAKAGAVLSLSQDVPESEDIFGRNAEVMSLLTMLTDDAKGAASLFVVIGGEARFFVLDGEGEGNISRQTTPSTYDVMLSSF